MKTIVCCQLHRLSKYASLIIALALISCKGDSHRQDETSTGDKQAATMPAATNSQGTLRIMSYNVLKYGGGCQGSNGQLHQYLKSIISYINPDVVGLVKVASIATAQNDKDADVPYGFADSIRDAALNAAFPSRFDVCPSTNKAAGNNVNLLFYNKQKLGYAGMQTLLSNETDFNLYKLYLLSSVRSGSHDTVFLYVLLNHTESGDKSAKRDAQMQSIVKALHTRFNTLPNVIDMGDFNLRNTSEPGYQALVNGPDAASRFADPPFALDHAVTYPADWEENPDPYARFLTTSTRKKDDEPNDCGTGGGAKFWFDHILLSPSIASGTGPFRYVPKSFHVVGNDGNRVGRSVNAGKHPNTTVPAPIAEALFQFSNKYPVVLELSVNR